MYDSMSVLEEAFRNLVSFTVSQTGTVLTPFAHVGFDCNR